jgi:L-lactate dehydrogenase complex protein LldG
MVEQALMSAKNEILRNIREALGARTGDTPIARDYRQTLALDPDTRASLFIDRLKDYNATVYRSTSLPATSLPQTIAEALLHRGKRSLLIPPDFPRNWLPEGFDFIPDHSLGYHDIDKSEGALTACTAAIALTGTIILSHSAHEGRRALTLIPDYHLCIVRAGQLVDTVPEGIRALADCRTRPLTTISGPSATADIEMIRVKGVHGPRTLDVIVVLS